jgi:hypothetical protein
MRNVDLVAYLPPFIAEYKEIFAALTAENSEFQMMWEAVDQVLKNQFIQSSDEYGISRREKMLGIVPLANETLEDRKFRLLTKYSENIPYTKQHLKNLLSTLCGPDGYQLIITESTYTVMVKVSIIAKKQINIILEHLERVLPCNMTFSVDILYNIWSKVSSYRWDSLSNYTWRNMKEEVLP